MTLIYLCSRLSPSPLVSVALLVYQQDLPAVHFEFWETFVDFGHFGLLKILPWLRLLLLIARRLLNCLWRCSWWVICRPSTRRTLPLRLFEYQKFQYEKRQTRFSTVCIIQMLHLFENPWHQSIQLIKFASLSLDCNILYFHIRIKSWILSPFG